LVQETVRVICFITMSEPAFTVRPDRELVCADGAGVEVQHRPEGAGRDRGIERDDDLAAVTFRNRGVTDDRTGRHRHRRAPQ
jgi:hypothetical protein